MAAEQAQRAARFDDEVGHRIQEWSERALASDLGAAFDQFQGAATDQTGVSRVVVSDADTELFVAWFHNDRCLPDGTTPAERYARRPGLDEAERVAAERIASARLGIHRVVDVRAGEWMLLEDLVDGDRTTVFSVNVSREAIRWDLVIGRLMGDGSGLWGPVRVLSPSDEQDLLAEIGRLGGSADPSPPGELLARVLESRPLELLRFRPPDWDVAPSFFTVEGDIVAEASATWQTHDRSALGHRVRALGGLAPGDELVIDITVPRDTLTRGPAALPRGALILEEGVGDDLTSVPIATLRVDDDRLVLEAMSEERLQRAVAIVDDDFGDLARRCELKVVPIERALAARRAADADADADADAVWESGIDGTTERQMLEGFLTDRMRCWVDDPHPRLDGATPRQAAAGPHRPVVVALVRGIENGVERSRRRGEPSADVTWLRRELGLEDALAA